VLLKRLPIYAAGAGFTAAVVAVADARHWSGAVTVLVAVGVAVFYVGTIVVPWLMREQIMRMHIILRTQEIQTNGTGPGDLTILVPMIDEAGAPGLPITEGSVIIKHSEPHLAA